jgi:hypothetical protein
VTNQRPQEQRRDFFGLNLGQIAGAVVAAALMWLGSVIIDTNKQQITLTAQIGALNNTTMELKQSVIGDREATRNDIGELEKELIVVRDRVSRLEMFNTYEGKRKDGTRQDSGNR